MAAIDIFPGPSLLSRIASFFATDDPAVTPSGEDEADRRSFILDMMNECPEAFGSEEGVRGAMYYFSGQF